MPAAEPIQARVAVAHTEITITAPVKTIFDAFVNDIGDWFYENEQSRENSPAVLEPRVGGSVYMKLPDGGFNTLATVTMIKPNKKLRLKGDFTMPQAFIANVTISFEEADGGTRVAIEHRQAGEFYEGMEKEFEEGWLDGLQKLKGLVESRA